MLLRRGIWLELDGAGLGGNVSINLAGSAAPTAPPEAGVGGPLLWYKAATTNAYSDDGVTPITDGGLVYRWDNLGTYTGGAPPGLDLLQVVSGSRPTYRADYQSSGHPALEFTTAGGEYLEKAGEPDLTGAVTVLASVYLGASGAGEIVNSFQVNTANPNQLRFAVQEADDYLVFSRPYSTDALGTNAVARSGWVTVAARVGAAGSPDTELYHQGSTGSPQDVTLNDDGVQNAGDLWVGRFDSQFFDAQFNGGIGELIIYDFELSVDDMALALAYLEAQHA